MYDMAFKGKKFTNPSRFITVYQITTIITTLFPLLPPKIWISYSRKKIAAF